MDFNDDLEKYHKIVKEEENFKYNYNKLLSPAKNNERRKLSQIYYIIFILESKSYFIYKYHIYLI